MCASHPHRCVHMHNPAHVTALHRDFPVSNMFLWGNTCRPGQCHTYSAVGTLYETRLHESKENIHHNQTFSFTGSTENTTSHCGYLRSLKISYKDNSPCIRWQAVLFSLSLSHQNCMFFPMYASIMVCFSSIFNSVYYFWKQKPMTLCWLCIWIERIATYFALIWFCFILVWHTCFVIVNSLCRDLIKDKSMTLKINIGLWAEQALAG